MTAGEGAHARDAFHKRRKVMPKVGERYVCEKCKQEVQIIKAGHCIPNCCGQEMKVKS